MITFFLCYGFKRHWSSDSSAIPFSISGTKSKSNLRGYVTFLREHHQQQYLYLNSMNFTFLVIDELHFFFFFFIYKFQ